ncbi:unnamed protein product [Rotaria sordida]|uniref:G-protein coupled receptors family 1 profile domain-containing protein n=1 Tax=Rotaria sordida TaxID=392033 RepID=A0A819RCF7_9BILA|nr:unnamed protein product [Rotaria sordida]CAF1523556.1 unnamed protein product [Rotaria sordida]CAF3877111.1 unnamed protein product [Rotaria sordida]CAF4039955.1 unnamed protein product [Rotaria sordida]CAF4039967.1 unnamed protein product [Rotaria sordida]
MSSLSTAQLILNASYQLTIYVSFIILFSGIFGHIANIFVYTRLKIFRGNPSAFYLIAESIADILELMIPFTTRLAMILQSITLVSLSIVCFSAIDQYLSTSYYPFLKQRSTIKLAKILITIFWTLHGTSVLFMFQIQSTYGCNIYNQNFSKYVTYGYYVIFTGVLPITISTFFSVLAYRNVRRIVRRQMIIRRRKLDQQLTAMILVRVGFFVIMTIPYLLQRIYALSAITNDSSVISQAIVQLIGNITLALFYFNYAGSFYLFLISSTRFRRQVKHVFINKCWKVCCKKRLRQNQVGTLTQCSASEYDLQSI